LINYKNNNDISNFQALFYFNDYKNFYLFILKIIKSIDLQIISNKKFEYESLNNGNIQNNFYLEKFYRNYLIPIIVKNLNKYNIEFSANVEMLNNDSYVNDYILGIIRFSVKKFLENNQLNNNIEINKNNDINILNLKGKYFIFDDIYEFSDIVIKIILKFDRNLKIIQNFDEKLFE
jgi:hypothetical protein